MPGCEGGPRYVRDLKGGATERFMVHILMSDAAHGIEDRTLFCLQRGRCVLSAFKLYQEHVVRFTMIHLYFCIRNT